jgi:peptidoglycan DL-endopeptidase CwlO
MSGIRRGVAVGAGLVLAVGLGTYTGVAVASSQPTLAQVQAKVNKLTTEFDRADQQYDQVAEQLTAAKARLHQVDKEVRKEQGQFTAARTKVAQIAAASYEDSSATSLAGLLTTSNPSTVLSQASVLLQLAGSDNAETQLYLSDAQQLSAVQQEQERTEFGIAQLLAQLKAQKDSIGNLLASEKATLDSLTQQQRQQVTGGGPGSGGTGGTGGGGGGGGGNYTGPTSTQADKAVEFAYDQIGCPYVYGDTGPCQPNGFDCSGLVMSAWAFAGVTIPRDTYEQWAALPHIPESDIEPGDLLYYNDIGHVAMYVGDGYIIDSPQPGETVERIPLDTPWYVENFDGAAEP